MTEPSCPAKRLRITRFPKLFSKTLFLALQFLADGDMDSP
jgi:hypothetical protein